MTKWSHHILAQAGVCILGNIIVAVGLVLILGVPVNVAIYETLILIAVNWTFATIATKFAYDAIMKSGLIK
jgi:hypothetical protein